MGVQVKCVLILLRLCLYPHTHAPLHSCHTRCSASSAAACRSDRWRTTSSGPGCPWSPRSCRAVLGNHRPYPRPHPLCASAYTQTYINTKPVRKLTCLYNIGCDLLRSQMLFHFSVSIGHSSSVKWELNFGCWQPESTADGSTALIVTQRNNDDDGGAFMQLRASCTFTQSTQAQEHV